VWLLVEWGVVARAAGRRLEKTGTAAAVLFSLSGGPAGAIGVAAAEAETAAALDAVATL